MSSTPNPQEVRKNRSDRFDHIDGLRAFAVILVVLMHGGYTFVPGDSGVTVFFGVSGFIITHILLRERESTGSFSVRRFYFRRGFKLAPPFIAAIVIPTLIYSVNEQVEVGPFLSQVFFSYNWVQIFDPQNLVLPGSSVVWSLAIEEQFYIVFAVIWLTLVRFRWWRQALIVLSISAILMSTLVRSILALEGETIRVLRGTDTRLDAIAWGVLAAIVVYMWQQGCAPWVSAMGRDWVPWTAVVLFVGGMALRDGWIEYALRPTVQVVAGIMVIVYGMIPSDTRMKRLFYAGMSQPWIQLIGLASYSIYLVHYPIGKILSPALVGLPTPIHVALLAAAGIVTGILLYKLVEVPALRLRKVIEPTILNGGPKVRRSAP